MNLVFQPLEPSKQGRLTLTHTKRIAYRASEDAVFAFSHDFVYQYALQINKYSAINIARCITS